MYETILIDMRKGVMMISNDILKTMDILNGGYDLDDVEYNNFITTLKNHLLYHVYGISDINNDVQHFMNVLSDKGFTVDVYNKLPNDNIDDFSKYLNKTYFRVSLRNKSREDFVDILNDDDIVYVLKKIKSYQKIEEHIEHLSLSTNREVIMKEGKYIIDIINSSLNDYIINAYRSCEIDFQTSSMSELVSLSNQHAAYYSVVDDEIVG